MMRWTPWIQVLILMPQGTRVTTVKVQTPVSFLWKGDVEKHYLWIELSVATLALLHQKREGTESAGLQQGSAVPPSSEVCADICIFLIVLGLLFTFMTQKFYIITFVVRFLDREILDVTFWDTLLLLVQDESKKNVSMMWDWIQICSGRIPPKIYIKISS